MGRRARNGFYALCCLVLVAGCSREAPVAAPEGAVAAVSVASEARVVPAAAPAPAPARVLAPDRPLETGDYIWNADGAPDAATQIVVDLAAQRIYVYRGGVQIGRSSIIFGADDKVTPIGTFPILQKKRHHVSNLYGASMPYMMRLTMDGIALHESEVEDGTATHGCIGLPGEFAALLFAEADIGDRVTITNGGDVRLDLAAAEAFTPLGSPAPATLPTI